jgi:TPR repeat protein
MPQKTTPRLKQFEEVAKEGNSEAQLIVGKMYMIGQRVAVDPDRAMKWCRAAADQGKSRRAILSWRDVSPAPEGHPGRTEVA